jgi:hypothetical protein
MYRWNVEYQLVNDAWALRLMKKSEDGALYAATNIEFTRIDPGVYMAPTTSMEGKDLQLLFNELWKAGFRPNDGTGNSGHVEALKYHLEDMRKLVFNENIKRTDTSKD